MAMRRTLIWIFVLTIIIPLCLAQAPPDKPLARVPVQLASAKKIFISNVGGDSNISELFSFARDYPYTKFYMAMKNWDRVQVVEYPDEADVVLEFAANIVYTSPRVIKGDAVGPGYETQLRLVILDPKTHVTLWAFTEHVDPALLQGNRDKNFEVALAKVVDDVKSVVEKR